MFDFLRWRQFLSEQASALTAEGFTAELSLWDHSPKPATSLDISGRKVIAYFINWNTGETDCEISETNGTQKGGARTLLLDDNNFDAAFDQFIDELRTAARAAPPAPG